MVYSAPRLSPVAALGPLPPPLCRCAVHTKRQSCVLGRFGTTRWIAHYFARAGRWCTQRSGIKEEAAGRGTAAELCTPSARASAALSKR